MKLRRLLIAQILIIIGLNAQTITGTTIGHYSKPGAPIDIRYTTNSVDKNVTSDINITLLPTVRSGTMSVLLTFDKELNQVSTVAKEIRFQVTSAKREYPINLQVSSVTDGLYYIRLLTKIDNGVGSKMRAFAVPITVGQGRARKREQGLMMKSHSGENISVSRAVETIRIAK